MRISYSPGWLKLLVAKDDLEHLIFLPLMIKTVLHRVRPKTEMLKVEDLDCRCFVQCYAASLCWLHTGCCLPESIRNTAKPG